MQENERNSRTRSNRPARSTSGSRKRTLDRRKRARRKRRIYLVITIILFVILVIVTAAGVFCLKKYGPSKEKADLNEYYGIEKEGQLAITINNEVLEPRGMISEGKVYLELPVIKEYLNDRFYWDANGSHLLYTLPESIVSVEAGGKDYLISKDKNSEDYVIVKTEGDTVYVALDFIQQYTNMEYEVFDAPSRVVIFNAWGETQVAKAKKDTQIRYRGGVKSPILSEIDKGDEVVLIENEENWSKVRTEDGIVGYMRKNALKDPETKNLTREFEEPEFTSISKDYTINMVWHNVTNQEANKEVTNMISSTKGLTTIVPTWYHVKNTSGELESISSADYVEKARQLGVEVWAAVRDFDGGIDSQDETLELLKSVSSRERLINQLVVDAQQAGVAGINVDFEKVSTECGDHYIQFIRELSIRCRQNGLILSVDNYVPKGYNQQYKRKEQGIFADYVVIMGYDEHFAGSPEAGSVSSYNFVKEGIEETLSEVPAEKVISGIPFFTRLWQETPKTQKELEEAKGTDAEEYMTNVTSEALGMDSAKSKVSEAGAETLWDEETQQNFATWNKGDITYKIWLEDAQSVEVKLKLMKDNNLAGTAAWALGQESADVWPVIQKYVN